MTIHHRGVYSLPFLAQLCFFSLRGLLNTFQACWPDAVCFSCYSVCACVCLQGRVVSLCCSCTDSSQTYKTAQPADNRQIILTLLLHFCSLLYLFFHILSYYFQQLSLFCCMQCVYFFLPLSFSVTGEHCCVKQCSEMSSFCLNLIKSSWVCF